MPESSPISFGGLSSGLDTKAIIEALVAVESIPIQQLEDRRQVEQQKLTLFGTFKGLVSSLRDKAEKLSKLDGFLVNTVGASSDTAATFSATGAAAAGTHTMVIASLAASDRWAFDAVTDPAANLASADGQSISLTINGTAYNLAVTQAESSLEDIAGQLQDLLEDDATVTVVNAGTTTAPSWRLVVASNEPGIENRITGISSSIAGLTITGTPPDLSGNPSSANNLVVGSNAVAVIDGLRVERSDNDFSGVIEGVSISALEQDPSTTVSFTIEPDKEAIQEGIQGFVDAYNEVVKFINKQNTYSEESGAGGPLFGDGALRSITSSMRGVLFNQSASQISQDLEGFGTLRLIGIESNSDGTLKIDATKFEAKLGENLAAVADLFVDKDGFDNNGAAIGTPAYYIDTTADSGLLDDLFREFDRLTKDYVDATGESYDGLFDARTATINARIKLMDKQIAEKEYRLELFEANLIKRFTNLETVMAQLNAQGAYLTQAQPKS